MARTGEIVVFTVPENHQTTTRKGDVELSGSIYHPSQTDFAAIVAGEAPAPDGGDPAAVFHLALLVPGSRDLKWVTASEGEGPGSFRAALGDLVPA